MARSQNVRLVARSALQTQAALRPPGAATTPSRLALATALRALSARAEAEALPAAAALLRQAAEQATRLSTHGARCCPTATQLSTGALYREPS